MEESTNKMMKKLMMLAAALAAAMPIMAATETVGGYAWTCHINGCMAENMV